MLRIQLTNMRLFLPLLLVMWVFMEVSAAQSLCDPLTQYEKNGQCCKMCKPGHRMTSSGSCLDPQCAACGDNEYQDKHTSDNTCQRQPYCDPNLNFQVVGHKSKTKLSPCLCEEGFHCSSGECKTCVAHTVCEKGFGAQRKGNHSVDTVCQKCEEDTFSSDESWDGVCKKWKECMTGHQILHAGTDVSDIVCEKTPQRHAVAILLVVIVLLILAVIGVTYWLCKGGGKEKLKACFESCRREKREPLREVTVLIPKPTDVEEESMPPEMTSTQEETSFRTPEENEDEPSQEMSGDRVYTDNGNFVTQENGKSEILSRQESQTQTFTD